MKRSFYFSLFVLMLASITACSKKEAAVVPPAESDPVPAQKSQAANAGNTGQLDTQVGTALQQRNYDAAVDALAQSGPSNQNLSDAQRIQYMQELQRTMDALARAAQTDAAAKAAYVRLGRVATGR